MNVVLIPNSMLTIFIPRAIWEGWRESVKQSSICFATNCDSSKSNDQTSSSFGSGYYVPLKAYILYIQIVYTKVSASTRWCALLDLQPNCATWFTFSWRSDGRSSSQFGYISCWAYLVLCSLRKSFFFLSSWSSIFSFLDCSTSACQYLSNVSWGLHEVPRFVI